MGILAPTPSWSTVWRSSLKELNEPFVSWSRMQQLQTQHITGSRQRMRDWRCWGEDESWNVPMIMVPGTVFWPRLTAVMRLRKSRRSKPYQDLQNRYCISELFIDFCFSRKASISTMLTYTNSYSVPQWMPSDNDSRVVTIENGGLNER